MLELRVLLVFRVGGSSHFFHHPFSEDISRCLPSEAFARGVVEAITDHFHIVNCDCGDVALARQSSSDAAIGVFHGAFLPRRGGVAKPDLGSNLGLQMRPTDKLGPMIECDRPGRQMGARDLRTCMSPRRFARPTAPPL